LDALIKFKEPAIVLSYENDMYKDALKDWWQIKKDVKVGIIMKKR